MNTDRAPAAAPIRRFYETRPLTLIALAYGLGLLVGFGLTQAPLLWLCLIPPAIGALLCRRYPGPRIIALMLCALALGAAWGCESRHPARLPEGDYAVSGMVRGDVTVDAEARHVKVLLVDAVLTAKGTPYRQQQLYWTFYYGEGENPPELSAGSRVSLTGSVYHPSGQVNPYGFDFDLYLLQRGITVGLYGSDGLTVTPGRDDSLSGIAYRWRSALRARLTAAMGKDSGLACAMLLGDRTLMEEDAKESFNTLGIAHILSVSGLHVGIIAVLLAVIFRLFQTSVKVQFGLLTALLIFYAWLTGGSPPVLRASVLTLCLYGGRCLRRGGDALTSLSAAFLLILAFQPVQLLSAGFQLSFGAVLGIVLVRAPLYRRLFFQHIPALQKQEPPRLLVWLCQSLSVSMAAQAGTLLLSMSCFHALPTLSLVWNLLVIPYTTLLMAVFLSALAFPALGPIAALMTRLLTDTASWLSQYPFMTLPCAAPAAFAIPAGFWLLALVSRYTVVRLRARRALCCLCGAALLAGCLLPYLPVQRYIQLSVGSGDAALVLDGGYTALIDTGETGREAADYLTAVNRRRLDALVLTHLHSDHAGGLVKLADSGIRADAVYLPSGANLSILEEQSIAALNIITGRIVYLTQGDTLALPHGRLTALWPGALLPAQNDLNSACLCLYYETMGTTLLLTADMTGAYERYIALPADVLKAGHHGSISSTGADFLFTVKPRLALISRGSALSDTVAARLGDIGADIQNTNDAGALTLDFHQGSYTLTTFLGE